MQRQKTVVDTEKLSKKYRTNVSKIISAWKRGKNDLEISSSLNIELTKLQRIRTEIEQAHNRNRYESVSNNWLQL